ncbi:MAG: PUA domain-containing protein, partial [Candidatus Thermoplasmatota archaeon]|nr:PUA domain-containing protein [Candidatus Thermoplasmatota archaeon]
RIIIKPSAHESLGNGATIMYPAISHISTNFKKGDDVVIQSKDGALLAIAEAKLDAAIIAVKEKGAIAQPKHVFL